MADLYRRLKEVADEKKRKQINTVKNAGFNAVRVPVTWKDHMDNEGNVNKSWVDRVEEIVDYVLDAGMYCILNVHHDGGEDGWIQASSAN